MGLTDPVVSLLLTDDDEITELNRQWREIAEPTDVLSFPAHRPADLPDDPTHLGDIVISVEYAEQHVSSRKHTTRVLADHRDDTSSVPWDLADEVAFLFIHGLLHLLGYDHAEHDQEEQMRRMETRLWKLLCR